MNAADVSQAHAFDPASGICARCGLTQYDVEGRLQRLASYRLLDVVFQQGAKSKGWTISAETEALYAHLERARVCGGA